MGTPSSIISQADDALVSPLTQDNIGKRTIISGPIGAVAGTLAKGADVALAPAEGLESALHHVTKGRKHSRDVGKRFFPFFLTPPPLVAGAVAGGIAEGITEGIIEGSRDDFDRDNFDRDDFDRDDRDFRGRVGKRFFPFFLPPPPLVAGAVAGGIAEGITEGIIEGSRDDFDRGHRDDRDDRDFRDDDRFDREGFRNLERRLLPLLPPPPPPLGLLPPPPPPLGLLPPPPPPLLRRSLPLVAGAVIADEAAEAFERAHRHSYYDEHYH
jgi:uncharacterized protein (DUF697 family)